MLYDWLALALLRPVRRTPYLVPALLPASFALLAAAPSPIAVAIGVLLDTPPSQS